jgi:hypothetical protein
MRPLRTLSVLIPLLGIVPMVACTSPDDASTPTAQISVRLSSVVLPLDVGQSVLLEPAVTTATGTTFYIVQYKSSAPGVVSVSPTGVVTGVANGSATVTVVATLLDSGVSAQADLNVTVGAAASDGGTASTDGGTASTDGGTTSASCTFKLGMDTSVPQSSTKPALDVPFTDPDYGLALARVTDRSQVTDHDIPTWVRHEYSRRPAFNVDSSKAVMISSNGWLRLYSVLSNGTMSFVKTLNGGEPMEPNWHPTDPNVLWLFGNYGGGMKISALDVTTNTLTTYRDLGPKLQARWSSASRAWTKQEGRPSDDGRVWCLMVEDANYNTLGLVAYDAVNDKLLGTMNMTDRPDHISTSPKGAYCVTSWTSSKGTRAYKTDFSMYTQLHTASEHSDLATTKAGNEVYVYSDYSSDATHGGYLVMTDLATGQKTNLLPIYGASSSATSLHISGTARSKPGYVAVSFFGCTQNHGSAACDPSTQWFYNKVVAVELAASPRIVNLAHTHYGAAGYFGETHATVNPDFTKLLFASSWESTNENDVASYLVRVPACATP